MPIPLAAIAVATTVAGAGLSYAQARSANSAARGRFRDAESVMFAVNRINRQQLQLKAREQRRELS